MSLGIVKETIGKRCLLRFQLMIAALAIIIIPILSHAAVERIVDYEYDDAGNIIRIITREQIDPPLVSLLDPGFINIGRTITVTATGTNILGVDVATDAVGLSIGAVNSFSTQVSFELTASDQALLGPAIIRFTTGLGETQQSIIVAEAPPALTTDPSPVVIADNNVTTSISLIFTEPRPENETYTIATSDASVATTVASTFTILAGQTQVDIALTGLVIGGTNLNIELPAKFYSFSFPVFVAESFAELLAEFPDMLERNLFAPAVGVLLQDDTQFIPGTASQVVGVVVGGHSGINLDPVGIFYGEGFAGRVLSSPVGVILE